MHLREIGSGSAPNLRLFMTASAITILVSIAVLAFFVSRLAQSSIMRTAKEEGAVLIDLVFGPVVQELATSSTLSASSVTKLDDLLMTRLGDRIKVMKVWLQDGTLVYASDKKLVGEKFPSEHLSAAFNGQAHSSFDELDDPENHFERQLGIPLIEIYAPFHRKDSHDIIAVGEVYNNGEQLAAELSSIRWRAVGIVGAITAPMTLILFLMMWRANIAISENRQSLQRNIEEARGLARQNDQLRQAAEDAKLETIQSNERLLNQIGQDLHDGPIQLVSILALRLSELLDPNQERSAIHTLELTARIDDLITNILTDLRDTSTGLVLPHLEGLTADETLRLAVRQHEDMTGTSVACEIDVLAFHPLAPLRVCIYRIVQECLNNAYGHAGGHGQHVAASTDTGSLTIVVRNSNTIVANPKRNTARSRTGLGLPGIKRRVEEFNGNFKVISSQHEIRVHVNLPLNAPDHAKVC
jgi:signal transduction histidine kinase